VSDDLKGNFSEILKLQKQLALTPSSLFSGLLKTYGFDYIFSLPYHTIDAPEFCDWLKNDPVLWELNKSSNLPLSALRLPGSHA
jgi:hypothetical protein